MNLLDGLVLELERNRELLRIYEEIGPQGIYGAAMLRVEIKAAEKAMASDDVVAMVQALKTLQANKE